MTDLAPGHIEFTISSGQLVSFDRLATRSVLGNGYSGTGTYRNRPEYTFLHDRGPIPAGWYTIGAAVDRPESVGAFALPLTPEPGTEMFGRSDFYCHGDNSVHDASHGCIVASQLIRQIVATYHRLQVVP